MHDIRITKVNQGWVATVGCQTIVFTDKKKMKKAFSDYLDNELEAQKKWCDAIPEQPALQEVDNRIYGIRSPNPITGVRIGEARTTTEAAMQAAVDPRG